MPETNNCSSTPPQEKFPFVLEGKNKVYTIRNNVTFTVPERYTITSRLGSGSYGTVCAAHDSVTGNKVAIKKCQTVFKYPEDGKRVLRELKLMKMMDHRNVLTINDVLVPNEPGFDDIYYVMDCMDTDLSHIIRSRTTLTEQHCKYIIYQILRALKYIHSSNVLHRDLKPANILMNFDCRAKICDFGLARGFDPQAKGQQLTNYVVTRWYRAPELLLDNTTYSGAIDIWAAGCIFAEMLRGEALFPGDSSNAQLKLICETLGVPPEDDLWWVHSTKHRQYIVTLGKDKTPPDFASLLPVGTSPLAVDFLKHMLAFNPYKRWNAEWLLDHPYLSDVHRPDSCTKSLNHFKWSWDSDCPDAAKLRQLFWEEILTFHPNVPAGLVPHGLKPAESTSIPINESKSSSTRTHRSTKALHASDSWRHQSSSQGGGNVACPTKAHLHGGAISRMEKNVGAAITRAA